MKVNVQKLEEVLAWFAPSDGLASPTSASHAWPSRLRSAAMKSAQRTWTPRRLLGEWQGTWAMAASRSSTGNYYITINKVEGNKVYGRSERPATGKSGESNWNFVGTLAENVVIVKTPDLAMDLTVSGKNMAGWSLVRGNRFDLNLAKK
jgi:hypothetical protein